MNKSNGIKAVENATIVNWGTINIGNDLYIGPYPFPTMTDGLDLQDDSRMLNRGKLNINYVASDGIELSDYSLFVNRDSVEISFLFDEGIDMDDHCTVRNRGLIDISYTTNEGIDLDDDDTEFINHGDLYIQITDFNEGLEVDDGLFINTETGFIAIANVAVDMLWIKSGAEFENHGRIELIVIPEFTLGSPEPRVSVSVPETLDTEEDDDTPDTASNEEEEFGALYMSGGDLYNYNEIIIIDIFSFIGSSSEETPDVGQFSLELPITVSLYNQGGDIYNEECASINVTGPFRIINEGDLYNEGTLDLSLGSSPISPEEASMPDGNINDGYFYNDGDILADFPFSIGPNPIDELWTKSSIGGEGENDNFSLGCDITITTSSRQGHKATTDNVAFLNQSLCGNSMITARLDGVSNGVGGIMIRDGEGGGMASQAEAPAESSPKMFMIASRNIDVVYHGTRYNEGDQLSYTPFFTPNDRWLRVERVGNYIRAYHSSDGNSWSLFHQVYLELGECAQIGLFATSQNGAPAMASFSNVAFSEPEQNFSVPDVPTAEAPAIQQRATVWPTPVQSQFTVEFEQATQVAGTAILRNELGQAIGQRKLEPGTWQLQWDANTLPGGLYLLEVQTEDGYREVLKVLKQ